MPWSGLMLLTLLTMQLPSSAFLNSLISLHFWSKTRLLRLVLTTLSALYRDNEISLALSISIMPTHPRVAFVHECRRRRIEGTKLWL